MKKLFFYLLLVSSTNLFANDTFEDSNASCNIIKVTLRCNAEYEDCVVPTMEGFMKHIIMFVHFTNMYCGAEVIEPPI
jgi:hypothetical protein